MCAPNALTIYLCFTLPVAATSPQGMPDTFDHFQPGKLNQSAIERLREGDSTTAQILLERAALLAPYEPSIANNLAQVRSYRGAPVPIVLRQPEKQGTTMDRDKQSGPADAAMPGTTKLAPLPALWPRK
ncbi:MAG: hypothetical protein NT123_22600 [Proteobacteria bacterium]|nr:hypothetical protein [Pseudomonadota bacterium]